MSGLCCHFFHAKSSSLTNEMNL
ncbi:hypothetical protein AKJ16_DCAP00409 [Drosera capensis]